MLGLMNAYLLTGGRLLVGLNLHLLTGTLLLGLHPYFLTKGLLAGLMKNKYQLLTAGRLMLGK
jgi:hypothetical protein